MVVAAGLRFVEPLGEADVNAPGVMVMLVAPAADQLSVLLVPEFMLVGLAIKDAIVGTVFFPAGVVSAVPETQPAKLRATNTMRKAPRSRLKETSGRERS